MPTKASSPQLTSAGAGAPANGNPVGNTTNLCTSPPRRKIPIIFAPGVMGSRLHFTAIDQSWDPDSIPAMWHWLRIGAERARTELRWTTPATVMTTAKKDITPDEIAHGYAGVAKGFYVAFLRYLRAQVFNLNVDTPVYGVGYDWRQSNKNSGDYFTREANRIMGIEGAGQCIVVSHSMGGMVTRSAMKGGLAGKVLGVVHIYQPVDGAVVMYRRFFTGATKEFDGGWAGVPLNTIIGNTADKFATTSSGMPGPIQLLPTNNYRDTGGKAWLNFKLEGRTSSWPGDVYTLYNSVATPPGIAPHTIIPAALADIRTNVTLAKNFHAGLARYKHPKTKTIHSTGLVADMAILFDPPVQPSPVTTKVAGWFGTTHDVTTTPAWTARGAHRIARATSDGTVPNTSGNPLKPNVEVAGVEHSAACNDGPTRDNVKKWIEEFLA
jgi:lecithin:cholesterol acyltransferase